jgi:hypothetical protein
MRAKEAVENYGAGGATHMCRPACWLPGRAASFGALICASSTMTSVLWIGQFVTATPSVEMKRLAATATLCRDRPAVG